MFLFKAIVLSSTLLSIVCAQTVPVNIGIGCSIAAVQPDNNRPSWVIYQDDRGNLQAMNVSSSFDHGGETSTIRIVPAQDVVFRTPIAVARHPYHDRPHRLGRITVYFFDKNYVLNEARWSHRENNGDWQYGATCPKCLQQLGFNFQAELGSSALYALGTSGEGRDTAIRVGFLSPSFPGTITEADRQNMVWKLAPLTQA
ncbi:hypothetical protein L218DRAFT_1010092 [Marasmius fiardii PR-910]|nr:hypothetical protein L218DRAFT_1010092 [Marasmius fiardii PR-910]